jgi:hypothetical protein
MTRVYVAGLALVLMLGGSAGLAAAQAAPQTCEGWRDLRQYVLDNQDIFASKTGVALLAELNSNLQTFCGVAPVAAEPTPSVPADAPPPAPTPVPVAAAQPTPGPPADSQDRNDACQLLTSAEAGAVIGGAANADTPAALPGASGCEFRADGAGNVPYLDVIYAQADGSGLYATLLAGASQETGAATPSVFNLGDKAFTYTGQNGPGIVVLKADKVVILEFSYTNPGKTALLTLASQAAARVH